MFIRGCPMVGTNHWDVNRAVDLAKDVKVVGGGKKMMHQRNVDYIWTEMVYEALL